MAFRAVRRTYTYMGKNNKKGPSEHSLFLPTHPGHTTAQIVDTHTHLVSTFAAYRQKYKDAKYENIYDFVGGLYQGKKVTAMVDVWCEAPVQKVWKEIADSAVTEEDRKGRWGELEYWFVMGAYQLLRGDDSHNIPAQVYIRERRAHFWSSDRRNWAQASSKALHRLRRKGYVRAFSHPPFLSHDEHALIH